MNIIIIDCFETWEYRADLLYNILTDEGNQVKVFLSDYQHVNKTRRVEDKKDYKFFTAEPYKSNLSLSRMHSHVQLSRDIFGFVEKHIENIDLLWVFAPPNSFVSDAVGVKRRHPKVRLIIDLIDLWPETMPINSLKRMPWISKWKGLRDDNLKYADMIVTECKLYKKVLKLEGKGLKAETLYLAHKDMGYEPHIDLPRDIISLCYLGSINHLIDIGTIGMIIKQCRKKQKVVFHIIGDGEKKKELICTARAAGAEVLYHGKVYDRKEKQKIFDSCHYGLNIMRKSACVGLTMKSIDYFEFGLPIINNIHGDTWDAVEKNGVGVNYRKGLLSITTIDENEERKNARKFFETYLTEKEFRNKVKKIIQ